MNEVDENMDHAGRQLQAMLSAALAIAQAVAERRDRALREAARQAGVDEQEVVRRSQMERLTQAGAIPSPAEVTGRGPLSEYPARSTADVVEGLRSADPAEVAKAWAEREASGVGDTREWDAALRDIGVDPDRARNEAAQIKADVVDPATVSRDAARQVEDLAAARVVVGGDREADRAATADHTAVLEQLHGTGWADHVGVAAAEGARAGLQHAPSAASATPTAVSGQETDAGVGAWQHGAEAPRLAGMAQTTRAGQSSLPGRSGSQLRRNPGLPGRTPHRAPEIER